MKRMIINDCNVVCNGWHYYITSLDVKTKETQTNKSSTDIGKNDDSNCL